MVRIRDAGRTISEADVVALEQRIGHRLPESYRQFLLLNNGGRPTLDRDTIDIEHLPGSPTDVQVFYGIDDPIESCTIDWNLNVFKNRISDRLLPIACDSFGNRFCITLSGTDRGSVIYCDFNPTFGSHVGAAIYYRVAPDFNSFLEKIRSFEDN
jgi:hypothetical protein